MKQILALLLIGFALLALHLSERFKKGGSTSGPSATGGAAAEKAQPTAAQTAALAGGQQAKWDRQGMSWTVPPNWTEEENESKSFMWRSPGGGNAASLIVSISPMDESFPTDASLQAYYEGAKSRAKNGEVDEVKMVEIDGLTGVQFREAARKSLMVTGDSSGSRTGSIWARCKGSISCLRPRAKTSSGIKMPCTEFSIQQRSCINPSSSALFHGH